MRAIPRIFKPVNNMNGATTHDLEKLSAFFIDAFPKMNHEEQVLARTIYQQLAQGKPLPLKSWTYQHESTFLLTLDETFKIGKKVNAARYKDIL